MLETAGMSDYIEGTYKFVLTQVAAAYTTSSSAQSVTSRPLSTSKSDPDTVISDTLSDILRIGSRLSLPNVSSHLYIRGHSSAYSVCRDYLQYNYASRFSVQ